jgi:hypothetical protein
MRLSQEQEKVTKQIKHSHVQIIAVAGCGKTTTNLYICRENSKKKILLLTYNTSLKLETKQKMEKMEITNTIVHTYHSFAYQFYKKCQNDYGLYEICKDDTSPKHSLNFDIIILDEMQDMTRLYFDFVNKIYNDNQNKRVHFCILGDPYQTIYQYNGSDTNYFLNFPQISKFHYTNWEKCVLNHTFRCTDQVAHFLNTSMIGRERILTQKKSEKVRYLVCDTFSNKIFDELKYYMKLGYSHQDIFVLCPSVKSCKSPITNLSELCMENGIPVFISYSDEDKPNEKVLENKLVFLTFHQSKGLERRVVIVMNFDNSYFMFYKKDQDPSVCPNELYVAVTRSCDRLTVVHDFKNRHLPFISQPSLASTCDIHIITPVSYEKYEKKILEKSSEYLEPEESDGRAPPRAQVAVTKSVIHITKNMQFMHIYKIVQCIKITEISLNSVHEPSAKRHSRGARMSLGQEYIELPSIVQQGVLHENVSNINSLLIMSMYEYKKKGHTALSKEYPNFENYYKMGDIPFMLQLCNMKLCRDNHFRFKLYQITNYNWIDPCILEQCIQRLDSLPISDNASIFEHPVKYEDTLANNTLTGRIDCIDGDNVWEFKCVGSLDYQHYLQLGLYMYLFHKNYPDRQFNYYLYNVYENRLLRLELKSLEMIDIIQDALESSFNFRNQPPSTPFPIELFQ